MLCDHLLLLGLRVLELDLQALHPRMAGGGGLRVPPLAGGADVQPVLERLNPVLHDLQIMLIGFTPKASIPLYLGTFDSPNEIVVRLQNSGRLALFDTSRTNEILTYLTLPPAVPSLVILDPKSGLV
jgi:hypothetical protein